MQAKYPGHCNLCNTAIAVGDEITRDNNRKPHSFFCTFSLQTGIGPSSSRGLSRDNYKGEFA